MSLEYEPGEVPTQGGETITPDDARAEARQLAADLQSTELTQAYELLMDASSGAETALGSLDAAINLLATGEELKSKIEMSAQSDAMKIRVDRVLGAALQERSSRQLEAQVATSMREGVTSSIVPATSEERIAAARAALEGAVSRREETRGLERSPAEARLFALLDQGFKPAAGQEVSTFLQGFDRDVAAAAKTWVEATAASNMGQLSAEAAGAATVFEALGNNGEYAAQILAFATGTLLPKDQVDRMSYQEYAGRLSAAIPSTEAVPSDAVERQAGIDSTAVNLSSDDPESSLPRAA